MQRSTPPTPEDGLAWLRDGPPGRSMIPEIDGLAHDDLHELRRAWIRAISFAIPCVEAVSAIAGPPLLEIGAGGGYWAALAARAGTDVVAADAWPDSRYRQTVGDHHPVETLAADLAVAAHPTRDVLCVWPEYRRSWCADAVALMRPGRLLHLIGEPRGGCTGDDLLFDLLDERFTPIATTRIPNWPGQHDRLDTFLRKDVP